MTIKKILGGETMQTLRVERLLVTPVELESG